MRYVVCRKNSKRSKTQNIKKIISYEKKNNLDNDKFCKKFKENCEISKKRSKKKIIELKNKEKKYVAMLQPQKALQF